MIRVTSKGITSIKKKFAQATDKLQAGLKDATLRATKAGIASVAKSARAAGYGASASEIKKSIGRPISVGRTDHRVRINKNPISLKYYGARALKVTATKLTRRGGSITGFKAGTSMVSVKVKGGRSKLKAMIGAGGHVYGFVQGNKGKGSITMSGGFKMRSNKVKKLFGPSGADMIDDRSTWNQVEAKINETLRKRVAHAFKRVI